MVLKRQGGMVRPRIHGKTTLLVVCVNSGGIWGCLGRRETKWCAAKGVPDWSKVVPDHIPSIVTVRDPQSKPKPAEHTRWLVGVVEVWWSKRVSG